MELFQFTAVYVHFSLFKTAFNHIFKGETAMETSHDLKARLSIEHIVHEGHGLDVTPKTIARFSSNGDKKTAELLKVILRVRNRLIYIFDFKDEITHVTAGLKWLKYLCEKDGQVIVIFWQCEIEILTGCKTSIF
jgi:uncharacterized ferritin-like protein (DUF455 family)